MFYPDSIGEVIARLAAAIVCGAILGWEREAQNKPAGLRTHMMVALGSAAFTLITLKIFEAAQQTTSQHVSADPLSVVSGVIGGIGFLGAGSIIQSRRSVQGITTAAAIWVVGAVGIACGIGYYSVAVLTVAFAVVVLLGIGLLEHTISKKLVDDKQAAKPDVEPGRGQDEDERNANPNDATQPGDHRSRGHAADD